MKTRQHKTKSELQESNPIMDKENTTREPEILKKIKLNHQGQEVFDIESILNGDNPSKKE
jgi:hypothetical protein